MKNNTARKIEKRLMAGDVPEPPVELLEKLKQDIPVQLGTTTGAAGAEPARTSGGRPALRLLAASLFLAVVGGVVTYRVMERTGERPLAASLEKAAVLEEKEEALATAEDSPAEVELEFSDSGRLSEQVKPSTESRTAGEVDVQSLERSRPESPTRTQPTVVAPIPKDKGKRAEESVGSDTVGSSSRRAEDRQDLARARELPAHEGADSRAKNEAVEPESRKVTGTLVEGSEGALLDDRPLSGGATGSRAKRVMADLDEVERRPESRAIEPPKPLPAPEFVAPPSTGGTHEPNDEPYGDMFFRSYGTNPFVDTEDDRFSTFGLDVDTGSYTLARSYLQRGHLPPSEAIRVEEFLNFFDYGDPAPRNSDFGLTIDGAPSPFAEGPRYELIRFGLAAREVDALERPAADLIFVIDVSGSMERDDRLGLVRQSLDLLLGELRDGDRVGLVVYGSRGEVLLEPTGDHEAIRSAVSRLRPGGSTNAEEGLALAYDLARESFRAGRIHRLILCSDGVANVGRTGADSILARVADEAGRGIELTTVGFGMGNYNDVMMEQLADKGDGNYAYVDNLDEARRIFVESLTGTLLTVARDAKVQVEFNPEAVSRYRLLGYENRDVADERFRDDTVDAGEIGAGHRVTALYEVKLAEDAPRRAPLATFRVRYHSTATGRVEEFSREVGRRDLVETWTAAPVSLRLAALTAEFAEILKGTYWAREGNMDDLFRRAQALSAELPGDANVAELAALMGKAAGLTPAAR